MVNLPDQGERRGSLCSPTLTNTLEVDLAEGESECGYLVLRFWESVNLATSLKSPVWVVLPMCHGGERHGKKDLVVQANRALKIISEYMQLVLGPLILTFSQRVAVECLMLKHLRVAKSERRFKLGQLRRKRSPKQ